MKRERLEAHFANVCVLFKVRWSSKSYILHHTMAQTRTPNACLVCLSVMSLKRKRSASVSHAHVDAFTVGAVAAQSDAGFTQREIADSDAVTKVDVAPITYGREWKNCDN